MYFLYPIMMQDMKKALRADPEIKVCIVLGPNQVQIAHLTEDKFLENFT